MRYRPEIDGLRAVAVLPVIFFHAGSQAFSGGYVGVDVFFVISGYLITSIILGEQERGAFSILNFYERRARRILPALLLVVAACIPLAWIILLPSDLISFSQSLVSVATFVSNVFFWNERGYFSTATELKPLVHTWSLAIEEQYYVFFPIVLVLFAARWRRALVPVFVLAGISSLALCIWLTRVHIDSAFYLLPTRFWELLAGSLLAIHHHRHGASGLSIRQRTVLEALGLGLILFAIFGFDSRTAFPGYAALAPVVGTVLVIAGSGSDTALGRLLSTKLLVGVGLLSYSAYLWHQPLFAFARHIYLEPSWILLLALMGVTFVLAYLSWRFVEAPFRDRSNWSRKGIFAFSLAGLFGVFIAGTVGWANDGFMGRYSPADQRLLMSFIGAGEYVNERFNDRLLAEFPDDGRKKVLVIGDSFGQDLVNAVAESSLSGKIAISTHQINAECGNLFLEVSLVEYIDERRLARCELLGWYDDPVLQDRLREADAIWLASSWTDWVVELLPQSVKHLEATYGKPVVVFGRKSFGSFSQRSLLALPAGKRRDHVIPFQARHMRVQRRMIESIAGEQFIDVSWMLCRSKTHCRVFTDDGALVSHDGSHLTREGARHLGSLLQRHPLIAGFVRE